MQMLRGFQSRMSDSESPLSNNPKTGKNHSPSWLGSSRASESPVYPADRSWGAAPPTCESYPARPWAWTSSWRLVGRGPWSYRPVSFWINTILSHHNNFDSSGPLLEKPSQKYLDTLLLRPAAGSQGAAAVAALTEPHAGNNVKRQYLPPPPPPHISAAP